MKTISISLFLLLMIMTTAISYAADKDMSVKATKKFADKDESAISTENVAEKNLTSEKTVSKDEANKDKPEKADKEATTEVPRKKNIISRFFSDLKNALVGKDNTQKTKKKDQER